MRISSWHFRWLWLCINIGWIWDISSRDLKKSEAHSPSRNSFSYLSSGQLISFVVSCLGPMFQYAWVVCCCMACLLNFCISVSSFITAGCKGTVSIWPHLPPPQFAGERLFWHQICGSRQAAGKQLRVYRCAGFCFIACFPQIILTSASTISFQH